MTRTKTPEVYLLHFVIHYLVHRLQPLVGRSRLLNLVFLADYTAYSLTNVPITNLCYHKTKNGAYQPVVLKALYDLVASRIVVEIQLSDDFVYYSTVKPPTEDVHDALIQILEEVVTKFGPMPPEQLSELVKKIRFEYVK